MPRDPEGSAYGKRAGCLTLRECGGLVPRLARLCRVGRRATVLAARLPGSRAGSPPMD